MKSGKLYGVQGQIGSALIRQVAGSADSQDAEWVGCIDSTGNLGTRLMTVFNRTRLIALSLKARFARSGLFSSKKFNIKIKKQIYSSVTHPSDADFTFLMNL